MDFGNNVNIMTLTYTSKLGLQILKTDIKA